MKRLLTACAALTVAATAFAAQAQAPAGQVSVREACAADMQKLCPGVSALKMRECMRSHADEVSDGCKAAAAAHMASQAQTPAPTTSTPAPDQH
jgi:hypothetical protein